MSEVDALLSLIEKISQLSGPALTVAILYCFYTKRVVWGWQFDDVTKKADTYEALLRDVASKTEAKLAEYERREHGKAA